VVVLYAVGGAESWWGARLACRLRYLCTFVRFEVASVSIFFLLGSTRLPEVSRFDDKARRGRNHLTFLKRSITSRIAHESLLFDKLLLKISVSATTRLQHHFLRLHDAHKSMRPRDRIPLLPKRELRFLKHNTEQPLSSRWCFTARVVGFLHIRHTSA
jgi:hypothetical protein